MKMVKMLVGSGDKIGKLVVPFLLIGVVANVLRPAWFSVGGPPTALRVASLIALVPGVVIWLWSAVLILTKVPRHELITSGPFALVKHPLYTGVGLLVLPSAGFLLNTWLGALIGIVIYVGSRLYAPDEERTLATAFGSAWDEYTRRVLVPWL
jgi:protein-S-isoprenylcysteine O-methyltransferase Ste14